MRQIQLQAYVSFWTHVKRIVSNRIDLLVSPSSYTDLVHNLQCVCTCSNDKKYTVANKQLTVNNMSLAVAEMGDRLATIDMGREVGGGSCAPFRGESWVLIQQNVVCAESYLRTKCHLDASSRSATIHQRYKTDAQTHTHTYIQWPDIIKAPKKSTRSIIPSSVTLPNADFEKYFRKLGWNCNRPKFISKISYRSPTLWTIRQLFVSCWAMGFR